MEQGDRDSAGKSHPLGSRAGGSTLLLQGISSNLTVQNATQGHPQRHCLPTEPTACSCRESEPTPRVTTAGQIDLCHFHPKAPCGVPRCLRIELDLSCLKVLGELVCAHPLAGALSLLPPRYLYLLPLPAPSLPCMPHPGPPSWFLLLPEPKGYSSLLSHMLLSFGGTGVGGRSHFPQGTCVSRILPFCQRISYSRK